MIRVHHCAPHRHRALTAARAFTRRQRDAAVWGLRAAAPTAKYRE